MAEDRTAARRYYQAIIKVNPTDTPERQASDIANGISYACALLLDEHGWSAERVADLLERVTDEVADSERDDSGPDDDESVLDVEAREIRKGDDLFGVGIVTSAVYVGSSVRVECGGTGRTFWPDEVVTVRRV